MYLDDEHKMWQANEDKEQIQYLQWNHEMTKLRHAMADMPRMREEYKLARRVCLGYQGEDGLSRDLVDGLNAVFLLERRSVVTQPKVRQVVDNYLSVQGQKMLKDWEADPNPQVLSHEMPPLTVARLFARVVAEKERDAGYEIPKIKASLMDVAIFFGIQAQQERWNKTTQKLFREVAENQMLKFVCEHSDHKTASSLIWKEMHDIIVKPIITPEDEVKFDLIGIVGQTMGIDLEERLLACKQQALEGKPSIQKSLNVLRKMERQRHSVLGRLRLRCVRGGRF